MARPNRIRQIEEEWQESAETLIPRMLNDFGSMEAVARHLDTTIQTIYYWCKRHKLERRVTVTWVKADESPEPEATHEPTP